MLCIGMFSFLRAAQGWEMDAISNILSQLYSMSFSNFAADKMIWIHSGNGKFSVWFLFKVMMGRNFNPFPSKDIWRTKVPLKIAFFGWTTSLGKILTMDNLRKWRIIIVNWCCCMWKKNGEFVDHLLLHCEMAKALWNAISLGSSLHG